MTQFNVVNLILAAVASSAVVSTILQLLFRRASEEGLERVRSELNLSNQRILATQQQVLALKQAEQEWLQRQRADAILKVYELLLEAEDAFEYFTRMLTYQGEPAPDERYKRAVDSGEKYRKFYRRHKPLFPIRIVELLDRVNRMFVDIANKYRIERTLTENEYAALGRLMSKELPQLTETLAIVEEVFRRMFGVTDERRSQVE